MINVIVSKLKKSKTDNNMFSLCPKCAAVIGTLFHYCVFSYSHGFWT